MPSEYPATNGGAFEMALDEIFVLRSNGGSVRCRGSSSIVSTLHRNNGQSLDRYPDGGKAATMPD